MFPQIARLELDELLSQLVERAQDVMATQGRLRGLLRATRAVAGDLSLPVLLRRLVAAAAELVGARYAALGVLDDRGEGLAEFITVGMDEATRSRIGRLPRGEGILGLLIDDPHSLRLTELGSHPLAVGFPAGHPPMTSFLGSPVKVGERVYGNLYLTEKLGGGSFTGEDEELLGALAAAAGVAIDNARLYLTAQRRQRWLEALTEISHGLLAGEDPPLPLIARRARECAGADLVMILLPGLDSPGTLSINAADGAGSAAVRGASIPRVSVVPVPDASSVRAFPVVSHAAPRALTAFDAEVPTGPALLVPLGRGSHPGLLVLLRGPEQPRFDEQETEMVAGFAGHAGLALELATAHEATQEAARRVLLLEDRGRIARDLHDQVIGRLFATGLGIQSLAGRMNDPEDGARLNAFVDDLDRAIQTIRHSIFALRSTAEAPGFRAAVLGIVRDAASALGFDPAVRLVGPLDQAVDPPRAEQAVAVLREALNNAARHARARNVEVTVSATGRELHVMVADDGVGLGPTSRRSGLDNLRTRAEQLGGWFSLSVGPDGGTRVEWMAPLATLPS
ncbi:MAG: GAF domain-containing protein [Frankiaceae bacterium]